MKTYVHARLDSDDRARLDELKRATGETESALVKRALRLVHEEEVRRQRPALAVARRFVGRFQGGPRDLSTNRKHLDGFGR